MTKFHIHLIVPSLCGCQCFKHLMMFSTLVTYIIHKHTNEQGIRHTGDKVMKRHEYLNIYFIK
jgi:hypothetical protein